MKTLIKNIIFLASVLILQACYHNKAELDANGVPGKLVIAVYAGGDDPGGLKTGLKPLKAYLQQKLGMEVEYTYSTDYVSVIEAIRTKKAHIAYLSPFSYVLASQRHDITPLVGLGEDGKPSMYHSIIFTNYQTGLKSMDDVKARAKSLTLCFADPASTSGHLIPRAYLTTIGLNPDNAFKQVIFAGTHATSILSVASDKIDVGCSTIEYGLEKLERSGVLKKGLIKVLWTSEPIVAGCIVVRNDINKDFAKKIQSAYLNLKADDPAAFNAYIKITHPDPSKYSYMPMADSMYNGLRKIAGGVKDLSVAQ